MDFEKPSWLKGRQKGCVAPTAPAAWSVASAYTKGTLVSYGGVIFQCIGGVAAGGSAPTNGTTWRELSGYVAETAGSRSFCPAINPYEALTCGRCGNPLEYSA